MSETTRCTATIDVPLVVSVDVFHRHSVDGAFFSAGDLDLSIAKALAVVSVAPDSHVRCVLGLRDITYDARTFMHRWHPESFDKAAVDVAVNKIASVIAREVVRHIGQQVKEL